MKRRAIKTPPARNCNETEWKTKDDGTTCVDGSPNEGSSSVATKTAVDCVWSSTKMDKFKRPLLSLWPIVECHSHRRSIRSLSLWAICVCKRRDAQPPVSLFFNNFSLATWRWTDVSLVPQTAARGHNLSYANELKMANQFFCSRTNDLHIWRPLVSPDFLHGKYYSNEALLWIWIK